MQCQAQKWFPQGATFTYSQMFWEYPFSEKPAEWTVTDTATKKGKLCSKLVLTKGANYGSDSNNFIMYVFDSSSVVYWYRPHLDTFTVLYDLNKNIGETWEIYGVKKFGTSSDTIGCTFTARVKAKGTDTINGFSLRTITIELEGSTSGYAKGFDGKIVEFIGHLRTPRPDPFYSCHAISESSDFLGLRCFNHPDIGFHDYKLRPDCDYVVTHVDEFNVLADLKISPNPTTAFFEITYQNKNKAEATLQVCNLLGQEILKEKLKAGNNKINASEWARGVYLYCIIQEGEIIANGKLVKQ
jgi:hypothetical protein